MNNFAIGTDAKRDCLAVDQRLNPTFIVWAQIRNRLEAYQFIANHQKEFGIRWLLGRMGICPNAYYNYLKRQKATYIASKANICREIESIYHETGGILGHRR